jgi:hypothetical protein
MVVVAIVLLASPKAWVKVCYKPVNLLWRWISTDNTLTKDTLWPCFCRLHRIWGYA